MRKALFGLLAAGAALAATSAQAADTIDFGSHAGNLGTSEVYTNGPLSVTAYGWASFGNPTDLYGKNFGGDEQGLGVADDPEGQNEIWYDDGYGSYVTVDVSALFGLVSSAQFFMGSTTAGEVWNLYGCNTSDCSDYTYLFSGTDELVLNDLPSWGSYDFYGWQADDDGSGRGNVLLGGLSLTPSVPEPGTWAMMLLGFGAAGVAFRRRRQTKSALLQVA